jgi:hypothetical protein
MAWIVAAMAKKINYPPQDEMPSTVDDAVSCLADTLPAESLDQLKALAEQDLINTHFGLGMHVRNHFSLWDRESRIMQDARQRFNISHEDDVSAEIIRLLWERLRAE